MDADLIEFCIDEISRIENKRKNEKSIKNGTKIVRIIVSVAAAFAILVGVAIYRTARIKSYDNKIIPWSEDFRSLKSGENGESSNMFEPDDLEIQTGRADYIIFAKVGAFEGTRYETVH